MFQSNFRSSYEEEILESIVIPIFSNIANEPDPSIRTKVGKMLVNFVVHCDTKRSIELLDIVEKLLNRPFDRFTDENRMILKNEDELQHILGLIDELIRVRSSYESFNIWITIFNESSDCNDFCFLFNTGFYIEIIHFTNNARN